MLKLFFPKMHIALEVVGKIQNIQKSVQAFRVEGIVAGGVRFYLVRSVIVSSFMSWAIPTTSDSHALTLIEAEWPVD